jgi:hypothetical protein
VKELVWFRFRPAHHHVADSDLGTEHFGEITMMTCACGMSRLFSPNGDYPTWFKRQKAG